MRTKERLKLFVQSLNLGQNKFEEAVGIANGYLASRSQSVNSDAIEKIVDKYPNLNLDWLFTGKGNMFLDEEPVIEEADENQSKKGKIKIKISDMPKNASSPSKTGLKIVDVAEDTFTKLGYKKPKEVKDYKMIALDLAERVSLSKSISEEMIGIMSKSYLERIGLLEREKALIAEKAAKLEAELAAMNVNVKGDSSSWR